MSNKAAIVHKNKNGEIIAVSDSDHGAFMRITDSGIVFDAEWAEMTEEAAVSFLAECCTVLVAVE